MLNVVAYPDLALEKFTGLDPNEDARDFLDIVEKKIAFSLGTRPGDAGDEKKHMITDKEPNLIQY